MKARPSSLRGSGAGRHLGLLLALLAILGANVGLARLSLGAWHGVVAVTLAAAMAALVMRHAMRLRGSPAASVIAAVAGFVWLGLLLGLGFADWATRVAVPW